MKKLTMDDVTFELEVVQDDMPLKGNVLVSGDDEVDAKAEAATQEALDRGNVWAWAAVTVIATWEGFHGVDHLGGCSYESEEEFKQDAYYADMKQAALDALNRVIAETAERLRPLMEDALAEENARLRKDRALFKALSFPERYHGMGPKDFIAETQVSEEQVQELWEKFGERYPELRARLTDEPDPDDVVEYELTEKGKQSARGPVPDYFSCTTAVEELHHETAAEAVEYHLDALPAAEWPRSLQVYAYTRTVVSDLEVKSLACDVVEFVLVRLDEDYGSPDDGTDAEPEMEEAAEKFLRTLLDRYIVWHCERIEKFDVVVDVPSWVREHAPHWLKEADVANAVVALESAG
jgi:hypothetical protein